MVYVLLENGFEETELIVPVDILRRGGVEVCLVGVSSDVVASSRGVKIYADRRIEQTSFEDMDMLILPGGQPGVDNLRANDRVIELIKENAGKIPIGAICAAPMLLGELGLLNGRAASCYPGCEGALKGSRIEEKAVTVDGGYITARGAGAAFDFGFTLLATLKGYETASSIAREMQYRVKQNG